MSSASDRTQSSSLSSSKRCRRHTASTQSSSDKAPPPAASSPPVAPVDKPPATAAVDDSPVAAARYKRQTATEEQRDRTATDWAILIVYIALFITLAVTLLLTLVYLIDMNMPATEPFYSGVDSILGSQPVLLRVPREPPLIVGNADRDAYHIGNISELLKSAGCHSHSNCPNATEEPLSNGEASNDEACYDKGSNTDAVKGLGACACEQLECNTDSCTGAFGYDATRAPCVYFRVNKMLNYKPRDSQCSDNVTLSCSASDGVNVAVYPSDGRNVRCLRYVDMATYVPPLFAAQLNMTDVSNDTKKVQLNCDLFLKKETKLSSASVTVHLSESGAASTPTAALLVALAAAIALVRS